MVDEERVQRAVTEMRKFSYRDIGAENSWSQEQVDRAILMSAYAALANAAPEGSGWNNLDAEVTGTPENQT